ncbi:ATP-binding protein [Halomonas sp. McH1-25]|uniref:ATP-binding protein n=1 Tax=unclassified Halomonas TaxID=2609666 RepID=UPI001EF5EDFA|nr:MULTISPECIES: ATP-binding protein [unclassified Halomonas]MCG7601211.1 ATP-binding protein [Halomonas sp. McH1-25]MCP1341901.1 ATP-binding protein [Halomonas sp. FL8]MCP1360166.1 ATP-binding protein [Halomonas sp. BBD45]
MRRTLADSTFFRVYASLLLALVLTFGLAMLGYLMVDQVRREYYRENLADAPMALLTTLVSEVSSERRASWLIDQSERLDMRLSLHAVDELDFNYFQRARLEDGRPLVERDSRGDWHLWRLVPGEPLLLEATLTHLSEKQLRGLVGSLRVWLEGKFSPELPLQTLIDRQALPVELSSSPPEALDDNQLERLSDGAVVLHLLAEEGTVSAFARLKPMFGDGVSRWIRVGPLHAFDPMPLLLTLGLLLVALIVLAAAIYLVVRGLEARMARLEKAATRIAGGYLDTRVKVESSDFMGRLGMAFNGMAAQVQSLLRAQQEMIRAVSHELRTPVARIRFAVQMVDDMTDQEPVRRQLKGIDSDIEELDQLIDEILTYARLGSDNASGVTLETDSVDCRAMAARVVDTLAPLHPQISLAVEPGDDIEVIAEPRYLQRALQNLVANACRHAESQVVIRLSQDARAVRLDVEDDGPGVPEGDRMEVFKPFARLDNSRTRRSGGYGLGLSIVQKIMLWHGGSVVIEDSERLGGACFSLLLPGAVASAKVS